MTTIAVAQREIAVMEMWESRGSRGESETRKYLDEGTQDTILRGHSPALHVTRRSRRCGRERPLFNRPHRSLQWDRATIRSGRAGRVI